jgi:hypothetical protein
MTFMSSEITSLGLAGLVVLSGAWIAGCNRGGGEDTAGSTSTAAATAKATTAPAVTIRQGKDGRISVEGAGTMQGDPKACAAFKKCCASPPSSDFGLFCGLTESSERDCAKALASVKQYAKERGLPPCKE